MSKRDIYRQRAEECLVTASFCKSPERKAFLTAMAQAWHRLAQPLQIQGPARQSNTRRERETASAGRN